MRYFLKELPDQRFVLPSGLPVKFDFMAVDEASQSQLVDALADAARKHVGGIVEITKEQYEEELKKKELSKLSPSNGNNNRFIFGWRNRPHHNPVGFAGSGAEPAFPQRNDPAPVATAPASAPPLTVPKFIPKAGKAQ